MDPEELADAYIKEAHALLVHRRYEDAIVLYDRAIDVYPESGEAWTSKASVLKMVGRLQDALECVEKALEVGPSPIAEMLRESLIGELRSKGILP